MQAGLKKRKGGSAVNQTIKKALSLVLLAAFLVSTGWLLGNVLLFRGGGSDYSDAAALAQGDTPRKTEPVRETVAVTVPADTPQTPALVWVPAQPEAPDPKMEALAETDLEALREVNPDVIGWIRIPGTKIDYPILQSGDNEYYLKHTWKGHRNIVGSIFMEYQNQPDFTDWNTILYGHNMNNGSMFAALHKFRKEAFWETHPYVYLVTDAGVLRYEIFSSYSARVDSMTYDLSFHQTETKEEFLAMALENSQIDTGILPEPTDRILTLSTCSGAGYETRRVVHARLPMVQVEAEK